MDMEGVEITGQDQSVDKKISFELPDFSTKEKVTGAELVVLPTNSCRELTSVRDQRLLA